MRKEIEQEQGNYSPIRAKLQCQSLPWFRREDDNTKRRSGQSAYLEDLLFKQDLLKSMWGCVIEVTKLAVQDGTVVHWRERRNKGSDQVFTCNYLDSEYSQIATFKREKTQNLETKVQKIHPFHNKDKPAICEMLHLTHLMSQCS